MLVRLNNNNYINMKRNILFLLVLLISGVAYGQKKPKINKALSALEDGELNEAKEIVDAAIVHEKTKDDPETWYYRALVYSAIDTTSRPEFENLDPDPLEVAVEGFQKAEELNTKSSELYITGEQGFPILRSQHVQMLWGYYLNKGVQAFQAGDHARALDYLQRALVTFEKLQFRRYIANTHRRLGRVQRNAGRLEESLASLDRAEQVARTLDSSEVMADIWQEYYEQDMSGDQTDDDMFNFE